MSLTLAVQEEQSRLFHATGDLKNLKIRAGIVAVENTVHTSGQN